MEATAREPVREPAAEAERGSTGGGSPARPAPGHPAPDRDAGDLVPGATGPAAPGTGRVAVRVRLFAVVAERLGRRELELSLPAGASARRVLEELERLRPDQARLLATCRLAVNGRYASPDLPLAAGDEVALIPPVSGGAGEPGGGTPGHAEARDGAGTNRGVAAPAGGGSGPGAAREPSGGPAGRGDRRVVAPGADRFFLTDGPLSLDELFGYVARPAHGAVVMFVGITRRYTGDKETRRLEYEAYATMAAAELARIGAEAEARWPGVRVAIGHRTGRVDVGEASVVIAAAAPHRPDAFAAARYAIEELKRRVPIWKREHYADGSVEWVGVGPDPAGAAGEPGGTGAPAGRPGAG